MERRESNKTKQKPTTKEIFLTVYRTIVGFEHGTSDEGCEQWYFFTALVINLMLTWWLKPGLGMLFTICAVISYSAVWAAAYMDELNPYLNRDNSIWYAIGYLAIHLIMLMICLISCWYWTLIALAIIVIAQSIAPDCFSESLILDAFDFYEKEQPKFKSKLMNKLSELVGGDDDDTVALITNTIWFLILFVIAMLLPISIWFRLGIIVICIALHPLIDAFEGDCVIVTEVTEDVIRIVKEHFSKDSDDH